MLEANYDKIHAAPFVLPEWAYYLPIYGVADVWLGYEKDIGKS